MQMLNSIDSNNNLIMIIRDYACIWFIYSIMIYLRYYIFFFFKIVR